MATEVLMPQLGMGMFEGTIVKWIAPDGATVNRGDGLVEIQTEKVIHTIEAPVDGVVQHVAVEGAAVPIRGTVGYILAVGESRVVVGGAHEAPSPESTVQEREGSVPAPKPAGEVRASPVARRLAKEHGLDLTTIVGSGPGGRIAEKDVLAAVEVAKLEQVKAPSETIPSPAPAKSTKPGTLITAEDVRTVARVTEFVEVDATNLVDALARLGAELRLGDNLTLSHRDLLIMIVAKALTEHRLLNSSFVDGEIKLWPQINIGLTVYGESGLLVPVLHDADRMGLADIVREVQSLVERVQQGRSLPQDLTGGTFTISDQGMYEIDGFTPIVNLPECATLGVGRVMAKPVVFKGDIVVRQMLVLSLAFDHRIVDGAPAARFLQQVKNLVENPYLMIG